MVHELILDKLKILGQGGVSLSHLEDHPHDLDNVVNSYG